MATESKEATPAAFAEYARFYDSLYADKNYEAECDYLAATFERYESTPESILDLGCGSGSHAGLLSRRGYETVGVDISPDMIRQAKIKADAEDLKVKYEIGDVRSIDLGRTFGAVIEMFAVMSYQLTDDDLLADMRTARRHLAPGGLFVFDAWYGPAVVAQKPGDTSKSVDLPTGEKIERTATSVMDEKAHTVEVSYDVKRLYKGDVVDEMQETHRVRYLFADEIEQLLGKAGFEVLEMTPFLDPEGELGDETWNLSVVARAV